MKTILFPVRRTKMHRGGDVSAYTGKKKESSDQSWYWLIQPAVSIGYQASEHYRPELGAGWRFPLGVDTPGTSNRLLGGPFAAFNNAFTSL